MSRFSSNASNVRFSTGEDERLIEMVKKHPILYDHRDIEFKNSVKRDLIWEKAGKALNRTAAECKKRWKSVRDHYKREKKEKIGSSGPSAKKKRAFYWEKLNFLDLVDDEKDSISNTVSETVNEDLELSNSETESSALEPQEEPPGLRLGICSTSDRQTQEEDRHFDRYSRVADLVQEENEIDLFFRMLAITVKNFRPDFIISMKTKVFQFVTEMEVLNHTASFSGPTKIVRDRNQKSHSEASSAKKASQGVKIEVGEVEFQEQLQERTSLETKVKTEPGIEDEPMPELESIVSYDGISEVPDAKEDDACACFGRYVAAELRTLPLKQRLLVQQQIQNCITSAVFHNIPSSSESGSTIVPSVSSSACSTET